MSNPILYVFAISHYCEKARWALDYLGIDYELTYLAPGLNIELAKKQGLSTSSVPILKTGNTFIQGSSDIIDWAQRHSGNGKTLNPGSGTANWRQLERRLDDIIGIHIRRYYYSEALIEHPATVEPLFTQDLPSDQQVFIHSIWPAIAAQMAKKMDLGVDQGKASKVIIDKEINWLETLLQTSGSFLVGNSFSRVDLCAASLCAPLCLPKEHPLFGAFRLPPRISETQKQWQDSPVFEWIHTIYRHHRSP